MIAIKVQRCGTCGALEDMHTTMHADGSVTVELCAPCGHEVARTVVLRRGEGYWFELPVTRHTMDETGRDDYGDDPDSGEGSI